MASVLVKVGAKVGAKIGAKAIGKIGKKVGKKAISKAGKARHFKHEKTAANIENDDDDTINDEGINKFILYYELFVYVFEVVIHRIYRVFEIYLFCFNKKANKVSSKVHSVIIMLLSTLTIILFFTRFITLMKSTKKSTIFGAFAYLTYFILITHYYLAKRNAWTCGEEAKFKYHLYFFFCSLSVIGLIIQAFYRCFR